MKKDMKTYLVKNFRSSRRDLSFDSLFSVASSFFEDVDTPISLGVYLRLKYKSYDEYLDMDLDPLWYNNSPDIFRLDYQCVKMFSKFELFPRIKNTKKEAMKSFIEAELKCVETNKRFSKREDHRFRDPAISSILFTTQRKISRLLGDCPCINELPLRFGPGNVVGLKKKTSFFDKLTNDLTVTGTLLKHVPKMMASMPSWVSYLSKGEIPTLDFCSKFTVKRVIGSELGFVPKSAKTDRSICTEPLLNSMVQLGIGKIIRSRLKRAGCNLDSQETNQRLAAKGSLNDCLATVDFSSASDTISYMTVLELLPAPWFDLLESCRSSRYTYDGNYYEFSKFSSMGNGYTFELESMIFYSLAKSCCEYLRIPTNEVNVYGDDVIIPSDAYDLFKEVSDFLGFKVNDQKSFKHGPFRESCGKDWYLGVQVRPLFLKRRPTNATLIAWCNQLFRLSDELSDSRYEAFYRKLKGLVPRPYHRLTGPDGYGDGHFISPRSQLVHTRCSYRNRGWEGYGYYTLSSSPNTISDSTDAVYVTALYNAQHCTASSTKSVQSRNGLLQISRRSNTRTVLRRAFHPWSAHRLA